MRRVLCFCGVIIFLLMCLRWSFFTHCRAYNFLFTTDPSLSSVCCLSLKDEFLDNSKEKKTDTESIVQIKKIFPVISSVSVSYKPTGGVVSVAMHKPLYRVNDSLVIMENNEIVDQSFFVQSVLDDLPGVTVAHDFLVRNSGQLLRLLHQLPPHWDELYECNCVSEYCIRLQDKIDPRFVVVCSEDQVVSAHMLDQCALVKEDIIKHGMLGKDVSWVTDIRFANYIVAYKA